MDQQQPHDQVRRRLPALDRVLLRLEAQQPAGVLHVQRRGHEPGREWKAASSTNPAYIGNPFAAFLLGIPDKTGISTVVEPDTDSYGYSTGFYFQDDWKTTSNLTLNMGLRWEYHPTPNDHLINVANFLPNYLSIINGQRVDGAVVIPTGARKILNPVFVESIAPTPVFEAKELGMPDSLRVAPKNGFAPRFGFAWRPFSNSKTVLRGGIGRYQEGLLGSITSAAWSIASCFTGSYTQSIVNNQATLVFPHPFPANIAQPGVANFTQAFDPNYKDPYVYQWNLTVEQDIGHGIGVRATYAGSHASDLGIRVYYNQIPANTLGYAIASKVNPFPLWGSLPANVNGARANYNAVTLSATKKYSSGLMFQGSYAFSKNLSNGNGIAPTGFTGEAGGTVTDRFNPELDYGNDAYTRRHRFLGTFLYELPFGRGKLVAAKRERRRGSHHRRLAIVGRAHFPVRSLHDCDDAERRSGRDEFPDSDRRVPPGHRLRRGPVSHSSDVRRAGSTLPRSPSRRMRSDDTATRPWGTWWDRALRRLRRPWSNPWRSTEGIRVQIGAQVSNLLNHPNYAPPNLSLGTAQFGTINSLQSAEGAGPRSIQLTGASHSDRSP